MKEYNRVDLLVVVNGVVMSHQGALEYDKD